MSIQATIPTIPTAEPPAQTITELPKQSMRALAGVDEAPHDLLTDEERTALDDDGEAPDVYDDDDLDLLDTEEDLDDQGATQQQPAPAQAQQTPAPAQQQAPAQAPVAETPLPAIAPALLQTDFAAKIGEIDAKVAALKSKFDDGEVQDDDFAAQMTALNREAGKLQAQQETRDAYLTEVRSRDDAQWESSLSTFRKAHPDLFGQEHIGAFNAFVGVVTDTANSAAYGKLNYTQKLEKAARDYAESINRPDLAPKGAARRPAAQAQQAKPQPLPPTARPPVVPPTLAQMPSDAVNEASLSNVYNRIDQLQAQGETAAAEHMIRQLTPQQYDEYLRNG